MGSKSILIRNVKGDDVTKNNGSLQSNSPIERSSDVGMAALRNKKRERRTQPADSCKQLLLPSRIQKNFQRAFDLQKKGYAIKIRTRGYRHHIIVSCLAGAFHLTARTEGWLFCSNVLDTDGLFRIDRIYALLSRYSVHEQPGRQEKQKENAEHEDVNCIVGQLMKMCFPITRFRQRLIGRFIHIGRQISVQEKDPFIWNKL